MEKSTTKSDLLGTVAANYKKMKEKGSTTRPTTKADLLEKAVRNYNKMNELISGLSEEELSTSFDFTSDSGKKENIIIEDKIY